MPKKSHAIRVAALATIVASVATVSPATAAANPPGGGRGFIVNCAFSHTASDDPIVHPGDSGGSHGHTFFGATTTDANSTAASLLAGPTTCKDPADRSGYWIPTLLRGADPVPVTGARIAYAGGPGVVAPPAGLKIVAGGATHTGFACAPNRGRGGRMQPLVVANEFPAPCEARTHLVAQVVFPNCWDGTNLDSDDHKAHMAYDDGAGACPTGFGVKVARLTLVVDFATGDIAGLALSSGDATSLHADFMNGWVQNRLERRLSGGPGGGGPGGGAPGGPPNQGAPNQGAPNQGPPPNGGKPKP